MDLWVGGLLGLVQGLTEFLPVSSSGHLVLMRDVLSVQGAGASIEAVLHGGTLIAVLVYFRQRLAGLARFAVRPWCLLRSRAPAELVRDDSDEEAFLATRFVFLASLTTVAIYLPFREVVAAWFGDPRAAAAALLVTAGILVVSRFTPASRAWGLGAAALVVGAAQAIAVTPGISRSGATIVVALLVGMSRERAASYSFLMSIPIIIGGAVLSLSSDGIPNAQITAILFGVLVAAVSGLVAIRWTMKWAIAGRLHWFAPYVAAVGLWVLWGWS